MDTIGRTRCPQCGALLRRRRKPGLCAPCARVGPDPRGHLPADFYDQPPIVAMPLLRHAVDHYGPGYASLRAFYLPDLAGAHALAGDLDTAVTVGHQAVDAISTLSPPQRTTACAP